MKTLLRFALPPALLIGAALLVCAQEPDAERKTGKVLLLKNGNVIEGDIAKVGTQWCVRRGNSEVWLAHDTAARLCADWNEVYAFMQSLINFDSSADRVKLARWCHLHGLNEHALHQAKIALELQPNNGDAKQIVTILERDAKEPAKPALGAGLPTPPKVPAALAAGTPPAKQPTPTVDVAADTLISFSNKVQPILMNKCATCHASGFGGKFHLERVLENGVKSATQRNLAAVMTYIDLDRPAISPLLVKAITAHGDAPQPALRDRSVKPFLAMQDWIEQTIRRNPQLKDYEAAKKPAPAKSEPAPKFAFGNNNVSAPAPLSRNTEGVREPSNATNEVKSPETPRPAPPAVTPTPAARDWCDPDHFNELYHAEMLRQQAARR